MTEARVYSNICGNTYRLALLCESLSFVFVSCSSSLATIGVIGFSKLSSDLVLSSRLSMTTPTKRKQFLFYFCFNKKAFNRK